MNLKPAEEWMNEGYLLDPKMTVETRQQDRIRFIRQIQADALRAAAWFVLSSPHDCGGTSDALANQANQLDPRPKAGV